jgi:allophanate hydrolase
MLDLRGLGIAALQAAYAGGRLSPSAVAQAILDRNEAVADPAIWILAPDRERLLTRAAALERMPAGTREALPLWGVPFAVKDNIDVAGLPTTAACPAFAYTARADAAAVARLVAAGAIVVGKTNLDQFATGLVGVRSPYGTPRNPFDARCVPGGSSSGSAVAVAQGLASFALGTDTAGSGRVPAGFCNLVGLKPSRGVISCEGVVPACRSLDCVSVFAASAIDAALVLAAATGESDGDPYARPYRPVALPGWRGLRLGIPEAPEFFGDAAYSKLFSAARTRARHLGARIVPIDLEPFMAVARLLYEGPWVAERYAAVGSFIDAHGSEVHPITRRIIAPAKSMTAVDTFQAMYRLEALRRKAGRVWNEIDALMVPTAPTIPTLADLEADPIGPNARLGTYTNFVNLLDLAGLALPAGRRDDGVPFGITLLAPAMTDDALLALGRDWEGLVELAVVGAHLEGQPLHQELEGASLVRRTRTSSAYRLFALAETVPPKPGLVRTRAEGTPIEVEVYALDAARFGRFVARIPSPLAIGTVELVDGAKVKGFVCEPGALEGAADISAHGGWRAYLAASAAS